MRTIPRVPVANYMGRTVHRWIRDPCGGGFESPALHLLTTLILPNICPQHQPQRALLEPHLGAAGGAFGGGCHEPEYVCLVS